LQLIGRHSLCLDGASSIPPTWTFRQVSGGIPLASLQATAHDLQPKQLRKSMTIPQRVMGAPLTGSFRPETSLFRNPGVNRALLVRRTPSRKILTPLALRKIARFQLGNGIEIYPSLDIKLMSLSGPPTSS
jgi:hypothetical protein